jgi:hypothetical protein
MLASEGSYRRFLVAIFAALILAPTSSEARFLQWKDADDPTFSGTIYFLECQETSVTRISPDLMPEPLMEVSLNRFRIDVKNKTVEFNSSGKLIPVAIQASVLQDTYSKQLRIISETLKANISIEGQLDGSFTASFAVSTPDAQASGTNVGFGTCRPIYGTE